MLANAQYKKWNLRNFNCFSFSISMHKVYIIKQDQNVVNDDIYGHSKYMLMRSQNPLLDIWNKK